MVSWAQIITKLPLVRYLSKREWLLKNSKSGSSQKFHRARMPYNDVLDSGGHFVSLCHDVFSKDGVFHSSRSAGQALAFFLRAQAFRRHSERASTAIAEALGLRLPPVPKRESPPSHQRFLVDCSSQDR